MIGIVGAGLSGLVCAHICQKKKWPYYLIAQQYPKPNAKRILLNPKSLAFLHELDIYPKIQSHYPSLLINQRYGIGHMHLSSKDDQAVAYAVSYHDLLDALVKNIDIHIEEVIDIQILDKISLQTKQQHLFSHLFICDGKNSFCRKKLQITHQLGHKGFAKIIHCKISHPQLMLRMSKKINGAILPGKISQVIFTGPSDLEDCIIELDTIQSFFPKSLGITQIIEEFGFQFQSSLTHLYDHKNILLLGDAAVTVSPLAAQGFNHFLSQAAQIYRSSHHDINALKLRFHEENQEFYTHMESIISQPIKRNFLLSILPLFRSSQHLIQNFGNRYA
ncbi:hypothetical protein OAT84_02670 [Gammaproteobacteria bacterium]|nr:hypothetical protein [Gammaproteobacteria bacterium]